MRNEENVPALSLDNVVFRYIKNGKRNILDHVSLQLEAGKVSVLMGASGCGKSTLAAVAAGIYPENGGILETGDISLFGKPLKEMNPQTRAEYLTEMFQNPDLQFCMDTPRREMEFCMENMQVPAEQMAERIEKAAARMGVEQLLDKPLHTLSGGEKQKVNLACLFLIHSKCILLDEPFANIDADSARELLHEIRQFRREGGTVIAIDHRLDLWLDLADEVIILGNGGRILARGIDRTNVQEHIPLLRQEGLFYPKKEQGHKKIRESGQAAVALTDFVLCMENPKKKLFRRPPDPREIPGNLLLEHTRAAFPEGAMSAVLGPSGSGKTTTFLAVLKQHPYFGKIKIQGTDLERIPKKELYQRIGIVFQNPANQFVTQNVKEEVLHSLRRWNPGLSDEEYDSRAMLLLKDYGLSQYHGYSPYMLSQGQQRRLAVLSVLAGGQKILLLDEPTYGQDYRSAMSILDQLRGKMKEDNLTVIFITHDEQLAYSCADRIYRLNNRMLLDVTETGGVKDI